MEPSYPVPVPRSCSVEWDPLKPINWGQPSRFYMPRIKKEMSNFHLDPPPGIYAAPDEDDITLVHALITGVMGTPYAGGFFYFILRYPPDYPWKPPKVRFMTTGGSKVGFNPNLYRCGKVCLSILGTWAPANWCPGMTLSSLLITIQSILNDKPYHNEPGFEVERRPGEVANYNDIIQHETLRVAVVGMLDNDYGITMPETLNQAMERSFLQFNELYQSLAQNKLKLTGTHMKDPFGGIHGVYQYSTILQRLKVIHARLNQKYRSENATSSINPVSCE